MAGTKAGGKLAAETNKSKWGEDFYTKIGGLGGSAQHTKPRGFAYMKLHDPEKLREVGVKGGKIGRRGKRT